MGDHAKHGTECGLKKTMQGRKKAQAAQAAPTKGAAKKLTAP
jgi:hypothetical protein